MSWDDAEFRAAVERGAIELSAHHDLGLGKAFHSLYELVGNLLSDSGACPQSDEDGDESTCTWDDCPYCSMAKEHERIAKMLDRYGQGR